MASKVYFCPAKFAKESPVNAPIEDDDSVVVLHHCNQIIEYLIENHGIQVLNSFNVAVNEANTKFRKSVLSISSKTIDSIISCCNMWKEFIDIDDFDKLVCGEVLSMISLHSSVISARNFEKEHGISLKKQPSRTFVTIVNNSGNITVYP